MAKEGREIIAYTGAAALVVLGLNVVFSAITAHEEKLKEKKACGIKRPHQSLRIRNQELADHIIEKSKAVYDSVASVPLEKMVSIMEVVCKASADAETRLDSFSLRCRVHRVIHQANVGADILTKVLAPGGAKKPLDIPRDYLGREPSIDSFIDSKTRNSL